METHPPIVIVTAMSHIHRALGNKNQLLWHIPADLKHFKSLTLGHPVIMGKNTFLSIIAILGKPLPGRTNIVLTRDTTYHFDGATIAHSLDEAIALAQAESPKEIHIGGGAEIYRQALPRVSRLHVTWVQDEPVADTFFPEFLSEFTQTNASEEMTHAGLTYQWIDYERKRS
jgi:dihydrofolate reductase